MTTTIRHRHSQYSQQRHDRKHNSLSDTVFSDTTTLDKRLCDEPSKTSSWLWAITNCRHNRKHNSFSERAFDASQLRGLQGPLEPFRGSLETGMVPGVGGREKSQTQKDYNKIVKSKRQKEQQDSPAQDNGVEQSVQRNATKDVRRESKGKKRESSSLSSRSSKAYQHRQRRRGSRPVQALKRSSKVHQHRTTEKQKEPSSS